MSRLSSSTSYDDATPIEGERSAIRLTFTTFKEASPVQRRLLLDAPGEVRFVARRRLMETDTLAVGVCVADAVDLALEVRREVRPRVEDRVRLPDSPIEEFCPRQSARPGFGEAAVNVVGAAG